MCTTAIYLDQKPYPLWRHRFHKILLSRGSSYHRVLLEYLAHIQDRRMVGFINSESESTPMDGPMDVSTPTIIPMWELTLGTPFRTLGNDQLCSTFCFEAILGKTVCSCYWWVSLIKNHLWPIQEDSGAKPGYASMERPTPNKIEPISRRLHSEVYCLEKTEDWGSSFSSRQNASSNFSSYSRTTVRDRDYHIRVCFRKIENGAEVSEAPRDSR